MIQSLLVVGKSSMIGPVGVGVVGLRIVVPLMVVVVRRGGNEAMARD